MFQDLVTLALKQAWDTSVVRNTTKRMEPLPYEVCMLYRDVVDSLTRVLQENIEPFDAARFEAECGAYGG